MQPPCKDCTDRVLGCHSTCEKYIAFDKYRKEISQKRLTYNQLRDGFYDARQNVLKRRR